MAGKLTRRFGMLPCADYGDFAERRQLFFRDRAAPEQLDSAMAKGNNRRLQTVIGRARVDRQRDQPVQLLHDVGGRGRADPAKPVGAGSSQEPAELADDPSENRMGAEANSHRFEARGNDIRDGRSSRKNKGQWAGPELFT